MRKVWATRLESNNWLMKTIANCWLHPKLHHKLLNVHSKKPPFARIWFCIMFLPDLPGRPNCLHCLRQVNRQAKKKSREKRCFLPLPNARLTFFSLPTGNFVIPRSLFCHSTAWPGNPGFVVQIQIPLHHTSPPTNPSIEDFSFLLIPLSRPCSTS